MFYLVVNHSNVTFIFHAGVVGQSKILDMESFEPQLLQARHKARTMDSEDRSSGIGTIATYSENSEVSIKLNIELQLINVSHSDLPESVFHIYNIKFMLLLSVGLIHKNWLN